MDPRTGQLLREHLRQQRGRHRIQDEDRSPRTPFSTKQLRRRAEHTGPHIGALCQAMHRSHGEVAVRRILGVLVLAKNTASLPPMKPAPSRWKRVPASTALSGATWNVTRNCH